MKNFILTKERFTTKMLAKIGVLAAVAGVLNVMNFPLGFAPAFYKLDFSEIPVLIGTFALGPTSGVFIEFIKILLNFVLNGTTTGGVGELANFLMGCSFIIPIGLIYKNKKSIQSAIIGMIIGTISLTIVGAILNYLVLLPLYSSVYGMPISAFINMGSAITSKIVDLKTFIIYAVVPFNVFKGIVSSFITIVIYKRISPILHK